MRRSKFDFIISVLITISIICFIFFMFDRNAKKVLNLGIIVFLFSSVLIIFHLVKNITLKKQPKMIKLDLILNNYLEEINESLINDGFVLAIDEIKDNIRIKHYKKEINKTSLIMFSVINCITLTPNLYRKFVSSISNQCKKEKNTDIRFLHSIPLVIVENTNQYFIKSINVECKSNMISLTSGISKEENVLYIMEKDMKENIIKYHISKDKLLEILKIKGSED